MNPLETKVLQELKKKIKENDYIFTAKIPELAEELGVEDSDVRRAVNMLRKNNHIYAKDAGRRGMTFWLPEYEQRPRIQEDTKSPSAQLEITDDPELNNLIKQISELDQNEKQSIKIILEALIKNHKLKQIF